MTKLQEIQTILGEKPDNIWGPKCKAALAALTSPVSGIVHTGKASSFADPADVAAFKRCKDRGGSDQECFAKGDNAIGCWGDSTAEDTGPSCALPPEDMIERWGSVEDAKHKLVEVMANDKTVTCVLKDRMPMREHIKNGAMIDLNPDAVHALELEPPIMITATWRWL